MYILGISAFYHDSAAVLIENDKIIAAVQEERFTRVKQDSSFPTNSINYCLSEANISLKDIEFIAFYDKPFLKFERLLETYLNEAPKGFKSFVMAIPIWLKEKLFLKETLYRNFSKIENLEKKQLLDKMMFAEHHQSHLASAFFPSPFEEAAVLSIDGVGEWATTSIAHAKGNSIKILQEIHFPHSLGLLYSAFTYFLGFKVNSGEYKVMGLAPYGDPKYVDTIKEHLIDIKDDGSFKLDMEYFNFHTGLTMTSDKFAKLFDRSVRKSESELTQFDMDLAASIQKVSEEIMIKIAKFAKKLTGSDNLCLAGGVALNCVGNGEILKQKIFKSIWIQPAAGDSGGALGCAYSLYYEELKHKRVLFSDEMDKMQGAFLGPKYSDDEIKKYLNLVNASYQYLTEERLIDTVSDALIDEKVIGWHHDRVEFGPRALGHRSIIGDARSKNMQSKLNLKIKYRESFRPFAPSILSEKVYEWFLLDCSSPYMLLVAPIHPDKQILMDKNQQKLFGIEKLNVAKSVIPSVTHVDYSSRIQSVHKQTNQRYHKLISAYEKKTGCPVIINTSFNVRGEPIVCTPEDSYRCFMRTDMDILVIDNFILYKEEQPNFDDKSNWQEEFKLD